MGADLNKRARAAESWSPYEKPHTANQLSP